MIVDEYISPSYPGIVARRYYSEQSLGGENPLNRLDNCSMQVQNALNQLFEDNFSIKKLESDYPFYILANNQRIHLKISYDSYPDLIDFSVILGDEWGSDTLEKICNQIGIVPKHELLADITNTSADQIIMPLHRLLIGAWDAGKPDNEILEAVKFWLQKGNPLVFCNTLGLLQLALNYFETLLPLIETIAATEEMQTSEFAETIQYFIASGKTDLAEFEAYDLERQAIQARSHLDD